MQTPWFWVKVLLLIGVVGWLVVFTGSAILVEMVLYFVLHLASIPEPYLRLEGQTYSWITVIRWCGSFAIWFFYGKWVWKKLIRRKSVISDGEDSEGKSNQGAVLVGKKIILSMVGVLAVLWVALFVSGQQVLVWEETPEAMRAECEASTKRNTNILYMCDDESWNKWSCTYFNGRRFVTKEYSASRTACLNFRKNR